MDDKPLIRGSWPFWRLMILCLCVVGLALCAYLSWHYVMGTKVIGCGGGSPCDQVLTSKWSSVWGKVPVSGLAAGAYMAMLVATFFVGRDIETPVRRLAWRAMLVISGSAVGSALWFTIVQKWILKAYCPYCMATHITGMVLAGVIFVGAAIQSEPQTPQADAAVDAKAKNERLIGFIPAMGQMMLGLVLASVLAVVQIVYKPPSVFIAGETHVKTPAVDTRSAPLVGPANANQVVTLFFDYKCPHCQKVHVMLDELVSRYKGKAAFVIRPAPLTSQCNRFVASNRAEYRDSCDLARLGTAIWLAKREAYFEFNRWWFTPEPERLWRPRTLENARVKADELVGREKIDTALEDPFIEQFMEESVELYGVTIDQSGASVPRLVYGSRWVSPEPNDIDDLITILNERLGLAKP